MANDLNQRVSLWGGKKAVKFILSSCWSYWAHQWHHHHHRVMRGRAAAGLTFAQWWLWRRGDGEASLSHTRLTSPPAWPSTLVPVQSAQLNPRHIQCLTHLLIGNLLLANDSKCSSKWGLKISKLKNKKRHSRINFIYGFCKTFCFLKPIKILF